MTVEQQDDDTLNINKAALRALIVAWHSDMDDTAKAYVAAVLKPGQTMEDYFDEQVDWAWSQLEGMADGTN